MTASCIDSAEDGTSGVDSRRAPTRVGGTTQARGLFLRSAAPQSGECGDALNKLPPMGPPPKPSAPHGSSLTLPQLVSISPPGLDTEFRCAKTWRNGPGEPLRCPGARVGYRLRTEGEMAANVAPVRTRRQRVWLRVLLPDALVVIGAPLIELWSWNHLPGFRDLGYVLGLGFP